MSDKKASPDIGGELLSESIKRLLMDRIMQGHYVPGERIIESRLAKELGTSHSPIREALRDLAAIGVVTIQSRRGASVRQPTGKELADVSLVRSEVDALAARLAAPLLDDGTLDLLEEACDEMQSCLAIKNYVKLSQADARFHSLIAASSANRAIGRVFAQLEPFARTFVTMTLPNVDRSLIIAQHRQILAALRAADAEAAAVRARAHQVHVSKLFQKHFPAGALTTSE